MVYFPQRVLDYQISKLHRKYICRNWFLRIRWTASFLSSPLLCIFHPFLSHSFISFWFVSKLLLLLYCLISCSAELTLLRFVVFLRYLPILMEICRTSWTQSVEHQVFTASHCEGVGSTLSSGEIKVHYLAWLPNCTVVLDGCFYRDSVSFVLLALKLHVHTSLW